MKKIRTRYAPSPTGLLHIGGARTALFSYLYAKHYNGEFIFRIEDTDISRNIEKNGEFQLEDLIWLGIIPDESPKNENPKYGPYYQSKKLDRYNKLIKNLLDKNLAYKAFDNIDELTKQKEEQRKKGIFSFRYDKNWLKISQEEKNKREKLNDYTIRIKLKKNKEYLWNDIVYKEMKVNTNDIGDFIIQKRNQYPTYNFAVVVDDHDMEITDVLRGEEHITNTPKQLIIYEAFGWKTPKFGHLTRIVNEKGRKLSKRDGDVNQFIRTYKNEGYSSQGIFNFLTFLGWTHPEFKEKISKKEIIKSFDPNRLSKSPSKFDIKKMKWFSKEYIKNTPNTILKNALDFKNKNSDWQDLFIETYKKSICNINDLKNSLKIYNDISIKKYEKNKVVIQFANELNKNIFDIDGINKAINQTKNIMKIAGKNLYMPIRQATTYQDHGPELATAIYLFGEKIIKERLK